MFEKATAVQRGNDLSLAQLSNRAVLIGIHCRLSAATPFLERLSVGHRVYIFRIAATPLELHYPNKAKTWEHAGLASVLQALGKPKNARPETPDGEALAIELLQKRIQLAFSLVLFRKRAILFLSWPKKEP